PYRGECSGIPVAELWSRSPTPSTGQLSVEWRTRCRPVCRADLTPRRSWSPISLSPLVSRTDGRNAGNETNRPASTRITRVTQELFLCELTEPNGLSLA